ncbi:hypothetical protein EV186_103833 [Labedaea rhizosphaerae]|uniref:Glycosyltransferase RgtA/B/C/D-like domain-containing protein n=2 Tax=Labedaea rhizosphaerae TaxID=598644 RepID=A0A4R6SFI4_LABRH|nr:hypothetical protein EV186_103833 [Labedaea rhizosphaerae]
MAARTTEPVEPPKTTANLSRRWAAVLAVVVPTLVTCVHALGYGRWLVDDAGITFAYARSVAQGNGPVLQPGATAVEGYSDPAWLGVLTVGRWLGLFDHGAWFGIPDYVLFPKGIALLCCIGVFVALYRTAAAVTERPALVAGVAGVITALVPSFVIWCFSGLENSLLALAVVSLASVLVRAAASGTLARPGVAIACGALAALAALTRPDGALYAAAYPLVALLFVTRPALRRTLWVVPLSVVTFLIPWGAYLAWRIAEFDAVVPNTALAKGQSAPTVDSIRKAVDLASYLGWPLVLVAVVCLGAALARPSRTRTGLVALLVPLVLAIIGFSVLLQDWMPQYRFATPVWPLAALATSIAAAHLLPQLAVRGRAALAVLTAIACTLAGISWWQNYDEFSTGPTVPLCVVVQQAQEYDGYARIMGVRDATVLLPDIGGTALAGNLRVADVAGLADKRIAQFWSDEDMAGLRDYVFTELQPAVIHIHGSWANATGLLDDPRMQTDYLRLRWTSATGANLVRRDLIPNPAVQDELIKFARHSATVQAQLGPQRTRSCGDVLRPEA